MNERVIESLNATGIHLTRIKKSVNLLDKQVQTKIVWNRVQPDTLCSIHLNYPVGFENKIQQYYKIVISFQLNNVRSNIYTSLLSL